MAGTKNETKWRWLSEHTRTMAEQMIARGVQVPMIFNILSDKDDMQTYMFIIDGENAKDLIYEYIGVILHIYDAKGMAVITEAWMSKQDYAEERKYARPSQDPNRIDALIHYTSLGDTKSLKTYEIREDKELDLISMSDDFKSVFDILWKRKASIAEKIPPVPIEIREGVAKGFAAAMGIAHADVTEKMRG